MEASTTVALYLDFYKVCTECFPLSEWERQQGSSRSLIFECGILSTARSSYMLVSYTTGFKPLCIAAIPPVRSSHPSPDVKKPERRIISASSL